MDFGSLLWNLIIGLIVGVLARFLMPGREAFPSGPLGWILTALLGIAGAFLGSWIARTFWAGEGYVVGWVMSIIGAIVLLIIVRLIFGRGGTTTAT
ncbi:MAG TPA: GlsB/YeaQ/YmgE family stress response membrane protein [Pyrinomonadaceae bacterium]|jgi:uncharacterized membrane protein YeaQ/YmgE (transglycosylase-associated protein family)|nr:GlsB/YeaQ/YmgE family stress response membrane protein [Pyrinomonadaceae bacterium]